MSAPIPPRPTARAIRREGAIHVDGRLDEAAWRAAPAITELVQQDPDEGAAPSERTEIRLLYDDDALYIGARLYDREGAAGVHAVLTRRDQLLTSDSGQTDKLVVAFDTFRNKADESRFELNPLGVRGDAQNGDPAFDPVWEGVARIDSLGWTAEMRIPLSQLHFPHGRDQVWGMQVWRLIARRNERDMWAFWHKTDFGGPSQFGRLEGIEVSAERRAAEVVPYLTSRATFDRVVPGDPFHSNASAEYRAGLDARVNVTSNLTLDATANPDFGQVEVDPATINLSAYETTYDEKRPFFTSGTQYFSFGGPSLLNFDEPVAGSFYSRRIGRSPQLTSLVGADATFVDAPSTTTILGAAKITGRTGSGLGVGVLDAVTNRETARLIPAGGALSRREEVEPLTNYFVARVRQDLGDGRAGIGALVTSTDRRLTTPLERGWLRRDATYARLDMDVHSADRIYNSWIGLGVAQVDGDTAAIRRTQESSAHYYQRVGRTETTDGLFDTRYDPTRRQLRGYLFLARVGKDAGSWQWELQNFTVSPGADLNDVGVLHGADNRYTNATLRHVWSQPSRWYHEAELAATVEDSRDFDGHRTGGDVGYHAAMTFPNYWAAQLYGFRRPTYADPGLTRGGPIEERYGFQEHHIVVTSDQRRSVVLNVHYAHGWPFGNGEGGGNNAEIGVMLKPLPGASITVSGEYTRDATAQQYITTVADSTESPDMGRQRYVFGRVQQKTFALATRVNAAFSPTLTLELFAQPYVSSAEFGDFKEFAGVGTQRMIHYGSDAGSVITHNPGQHGPAQYTVDPDGAGRAAAFSFTDPNFTYRSLRGTAVLRWEYHRGSTLYLVWTQQREATNDIGTFDIGRDESAIFHDRPVNVYQLKLTYWLGR